MFLGTHQDNMADMVAKGRVGRAAKLNPEIVSMIREEVDSGRSTRDEMARKFGVTKTAIGLICRRETWRHVKDENTSGWVRRWYGNSKLTPDIVREIRTEVDSGRATRTNMARKFSVSLETIGIICSRRSWRNVA
jgi:DNA-binding XRE family transcriptional regulator